MYGTEQFVQASILFAALTIISLFSTSTPYLILLTGGALMIFFTFRSLSDRLSRRVLLVQFFLFAAFAAVSGNTAAYLIFYEFRGYSETHRQRAVRLLLPPAVYFAVSVFAAAGGIFCPAAEIDFPHILLTSLILFAAALLLSIVERFAARLILAKKENEQVVNMTALAELYEKKLNQELVMKNYLADKNARLEERENISRNIHNSVGHSVTAAIMALDAAELLLDKDAVRAREKIMAANRRIHAGLDSIRQAVRILDDENNFFPADNLICRMEELAENFMMDTALQIRTDAAQVPPDLFIPREYGEFFIGALSELITNGVRHGNAENFSVHIAADSAHIQIRVSDDGVSDFCAQNSKAKIENGYGLKKLISFAEKCGGSAAFENHMGFRSVITLPLYPVNME